MKILAIVAVLFGSSQVAGFIPLIGQSHYHRQLQQQHVSLNMASAGASKLETYTVKPVKSLDGTVTLPGSKSLSNRCLLLAALSEGKTKVENLLDSDDIRYMLGALDQMKVPVEKHSADSVTVTGQSGPINSPVGDDGVCELFLGNAGTAMRPLTAALCMGKGKFILDGVPRMRERPIRDLVEGLKQFGADVSCVEETGCPPVTINANGVKNGRVSCKNLELSSSRHCFVWSHTVNFPTTHTRRPLVGKCLLSSFPLF